MESVLARVLGTFAVGLTLIGGLLLGLPIDDTNGCGTLLSHDVECPGTDSRIALVVVVFGLALTCFFAAFGALPPRKDQDEKPTVYPGGAQV